MCQALLKVMEPEINKIVELEINKIMELERKKIVESERRKSVFIAVRSFRDLGANDDKIIEILKKNYGFSMEEAVEYL